MTMLVGAHLDNVDIPPDSSYRRLRLMRAEVALTLWTAGTRHRRGVYAELKRVGVRKVCIRVGDERIAGSVSDFLKDVDAGVQEAKSGGYAEHDLDVQILNEPNLAESDPAKVGRFVGEVQRSWRRDARPVLPPLSRGVPGWQAYLAAMVAAYGDLDRGRETACGRHAYLTDAENLESADGGSVVTEFSHPTLIGRERGRWVVERLKEFARKGYEYAVQFIVDGKTGGAWPENYRMTDDEATAIGERGALPAADPRPKPKEAGMRLALLYRMGADVPEKSVDELADLCHRGGFSAISPKAMDADAWEGSFDGDPVLAIGDADDLQLQKLAYEKAGIGYEPWVVYRGLDAGAEAVAHATVGRICRTLIVDFEWRYPGFADRGSWDDAVRYFRLLREGAPGVTIVFCPDPRQVRRAEYPVADILPFVDVISPQTYWTDFQQPWSKVLDDGLFADYGGRDVWPMLPGNSEPGDLDQALTRLENEWHSARPPTIYLFQRVGLREENLPILALHKTLGELVIGPTEPSEEDDVPKPNVDPAEYEGAFWGPLYRRNQESAATVAKLRATGKHADALLADALEASDAQVRAAVSLNKVAHGAEAA